MKSKTLQKVLAIFLALGMLISYLPISASAQAPVTQDVIATNPDASELGLGEFFLGDFEPTGEQPMDDITLSLDDGVAEDAIGIGGGSALIAVNRFTPPAGQFPMLLTEVQYSMQQSGQTVVGDPVRVVIYKNTTGNTDPAVGSEFLYQQSATVASITTWNTVVLDTPVILDGPGDVLIGVIYEKTPGSAYYPASIDQTSSQERSWAGWWSGTIPTTPTLPPDANWLLIDTASPDIDGGNWMIRGKAESMGEYQLTGTVTNTLDAPVVDATITLNPGGRTSKTNASGVYSMMVDAGEYTATAGKFGYLDQTKPVSIPEGATEPVVLDFQLEGLSNITVKGVVSDGGTDGTNKHGYPLYAKITFSTDGDTQVVYTHPLTGAYEVVLLSNNEYTAEVEAMVSGYAILNDTFTPIGELEFVKDFELLIDVAACAAPGYAPDYKYYFDFENDNGGFLSSGANSSWAWGAITSGPGTGHSGTNGIATNLSGNHNASELSYMTSPVIDLSSFGTSVPLIQWWDWKYFESATFDNITLEVTKNGGTTWTSVWGPIGGINDTGKPYTQQTVSLDPSYNVADFQLRFKMKSDGSVQYLGAYIDDLGIGMIEVPPATVVYEEDFESNDGGYVVSVFDDTITEGLPTWAWGTPSATPGPGAAYSGSKVWSTNLTGSYNNNERSRLTSPVIDLSAYEGNSITISFWQWMDTESNTYDWGAVEVTKDGGVTWTTMYQKFGDIMPWSFKEIILDPSYAVENFQMRFYLRTDSSGVYPGWYIDDIKISYSIPFALAVDCNVVPGGVVAGYAIDHWEQEKMYDVRVESESAAAVTKTESGHPESDGLYWLFQPFTGTGATETIAFSASKEKFGVETADVVVKQSQIVRQDWELSSGLLVANPEALERTIALFDDPETTTLTIENLGAVDSTFSLTEHNIGFQPYSIPPFTGELESSNDVVATADTSASTFATNRQLQSASESILQLEGGPMAYIVEVRSNNQLFRFPDITVPGTWEAVASAGTYYAGDFLKDDYSQIYAISDTDAFHSIDTTTGAATTITQLTVPGIGGGGVQGIAGANGFFYGITSNCSSGSDIFTLSPTGDIDIIINTSIACGIDIAYVPDNGLLYVVDITTDHLYSVNPNTAEVIDVGALGFAAGFAQGMDYDEENKILYWAAYGSGGNGQLRVIDMVTGASTLVGAFPGDNESDVLSIAAYAGGGGGDTGGAVPWLTETPEEGLVAGLGTFDIEIEFNVNGIEQPGDYFAELRFKNDTPYELEAIPVTMHVVRPLNWGNIKANIYALEQCDVAPAPAEKAGVNFYKNGQLVASTETDEDGYFSYALQHGTYDVEIVLVDYVSQTINDVVVGWDEDTILDDINLRLDAACLIVDPESIYQEQFPDRITEQTITFVNIGAKETVFELTEKDMGGPTPFRKMADEVNLILDDGSYDNALGVGGTADFIAVNRFSPTADQFPMTLTEVSLYFEGTTVASGQPFKVVIYQNTSGNSDPAVGSALLHQQSATVGSVPGWTVVTLDQPVVLEGPGDVLVGSVFTHKPGAAYFPASMDQTASQGRSWVGYWVAADAPAVPTLPPDDAWATVDSVGFAGNWMIRAKGTTGGGGGGGTGGDIVWLDIDVLADVVTPDGGEVEVTLTFDSTGLTTGDYFGEIHVANAPDPKITIPVQLRVWDFYRIFAPFTVTRYPHPSK